MNQKRKLDGSSGLTNSEKGISQTKRLKKSQQFVLEIKMEKWIANSTSIHESLNLLSSSMKIGSSNEQKEQALSALLYNSIQQEDVLNISQLTNQCVIYKHDVDEQHNVVKIYMHPSEDFDYSKAYSTPSNVEIKSLGSTNYSENDSQFDQEFGQSSFQLQNYEVGHLNDEGI